MQKEAMHMENIETANTSSPILSKKKYVFHAPQNRKRKMVNDNISSISAVIDKLDNVVQNNKNETDNEFEIFGKHVAVQLKQMPLYDAIMCQEQIQTIMRQKRLELLTRQSSSSCHTTLSSGISPIHQTTPSPARSNATEEEYWSSSVSNPSCSREERGKDTLQSSDILAKAINDILNDNYK